jgi:hypothetical protein
MRRYKVVAVYEHLVDVEIPCTSKIGTDRENLRSVEYSYLVLTRISAVGDDGCRFEASTILPTTMAKVPT